MNIKLILTGLTVIVFNIIIGVIAIMKIHLPYQTTMAVLSVISLLLWFFLLYKNISLHRKVIDISMKKASALLFLIPAGISIYLLMTSLNVDYNMIGSLFITALVVAVYEEILFRLIGLGTLLSSNVASNKAIIISSIIFAISHAIYNPVISWNLLLLLLNTFMMGFIVGYIYYKTYNLLLIMAIHFVWDFTVFINQRLPSQDIGLVISLILFTTTVLYFSWSYRQVKYI